MKLFVLSLGLLSISPVLSYVTYTDSSEESQYESDMSDEWRESPKPSFCNEIPNWSREYLASPRGIVAKFVCLADESYAKSEFYRILAGFSNKDYLSLFSNELKQFSYLLHKNEQNFLQKRFVQRQGGIKVLAEQRNPVIYPISVNLGNRVIEIAGEKGKFHALPQDNAPCAPVASPPLPVDIYSRYQFPVTEFVRFPGNIPEQNFQMSWLYFTKATDQQLLEVSPLTLLVKFNHFFLAKQLTNTIWSKLSQESFVNEYLNSMNVISETYPWYFRSDVNTDGFHAGFQRSVLNSNIKLFLLDICYPLYHAVLSLSEEFGEFYCALKYIVSSSDTEYSLRNLYQNAQAISVNSETRTKSSIRLHTERHEEVVENGVFTDIPLADDYPFSITDVVLKAKRGDFAIAVFGDTTMPPNGESMDSKE